MHATLCRTYVALLLSLGAHAVPAQDPVRLNIPASGIEAVVVHEHAATVKLNPGAAARLRAFTRDHVGQLAEVVVDDLPGLRAVIRTEIGSGRLQYAHPAPEVRKRLEDLKRSLPTK